VIAIDRISVGYGVAGTTRAVVLGAERIDAGAARIPEPGAETIVDLARLAPPQPHSLDLEMQFKYLRLDPMFAKS
jgi:hypothetical protein